MRFQLPKGQAGRDLFALLAGQPMPLLDATHLGLVVLPSVQRAHAAQPIRRRKQ